jgi:hypothetical protein
MPSGINAPNAPKYGYARDSHRATADPNNPAPMNLACLADYQTQTDTSRVKQRCGTNEAKSIRQSRRAFWHFCP